jgi:hypothetical protein
MRIAKRTRRTRETATRRDPVSRMTAAACDLRAPCGVCDDAAPFAAKRLP